MQTIYQKMETTELDAAIEALKAEVAEVKAKGLALDMARGKPSPSQVDISRPMLDILNADADLHDATSTAPITAASRAFPRHASWQGSSWLPRRADARAGFVEPFDRARHRRYVLALWLVRQRALGRLRAAHDGKKVKFLCPVPATIATLASPPTWASRTSPLR